MSLENLINVRVQIVDLSSGLFVINERMLTIQYDRRDQSPRDLHIRTKNCWRSQRETLSFLSGIRDRNKKSSSGAEGGRKACRGHRGGGHSDSIQEAE